MKFNSPPSTSDILFSGDYSVLAVQLGCKEDKYRNLNKVSEAISLSININDNVLEMKSIRTDEEC
jgi:hypothetical protein